MANNFEQQLMFLKTHSGFLYRLCNSLHGGIYNCYDTRNKYNILETQCGLLHEVLIELIGSEGCEYYCDTETYPKNEHTFQFLSACDFRSKLFKLLNKNGVVIFKYT